MSPAEMLLGLVPTTVIGGTSGWTPRVGKMIDLPDQLAVFYDTGGQNPNPRWLVDFVMVMVQVRAKPNAYGEGWAKIREVRDSLLGMDSRDVGSDRLISIICQGDVGFISYDDKERPLFSVNFRVIIEPAANVLDQREAL